ncbi:putative triacylglycerol lipase [Medicago truncatula]|uniref:GDSL-like lipase/acylhydrolase n=2 Tax=Medicago truncatula TaxID=3880 RepID=A0A072V4A9_MEDTR|nr:GDSL-like lipase/acylhydrolase [Medicago truncatula]RHN72186.1 putative triacylglycerol lipase [Medicago truncatula]
MACEIKTWLMVLILIFSANYLQQFVNGKSQVPCLFIFGDSLSDSGNNNNLPTSAKSNYKPYGIDFPMGPTGRFTNGRTSIDIITQLLGFEKFIPPFANINGSDILKGVNYASGAAGIRIETSITTGFVISLGLQLENHKVIVSRIASRLEGIDKAQEYLSKCLYYVNIGSNDYINNYFRPQFYPTSQIYSPEQYAEALIQELSLNLLTLHDIGARKYVLVGLGLLGCTPSAIFTHGTNGSCVDEENAPALIFNFKLKFLVDHFNNKFSADSKFIFVNTTLESDAQNSDGFLVSNVPCCPSGCIPDERPCYNRSEYAFWDEVHPTEASNQLYAIRSYNSHNSGFTYPMDIKNLVEQEIEMELDFTSQLSASS